MTIKMPKLDTLAKTFQVVAGGLNAAGAYSQAQAQKAYARYGAAVSRNNAQIARWQTASILQKGAREEQSQRLKTAQLIGAQRARLSANGVDVGFGSALNLLMDSEYIGELDASTIRDNTGREAWASRVQEVNYLNDAAMQDAQANAISPGLAAAGSLLGSAGQVASSWYQYSKTKKAG